MEILSSLGLLIVVLVAFSLMAGGRASNVLRPAMGIANNLIAMAVRVVLSALGGIVNVN